MTTNKKLDVDEVISIFRESLNYHYLYDDQMNSAACENLITLCKQLREGRRWQRLDISTPELEKVKQSGQDVLIYVDKTNEMFVAYYQSKSWTFAVGEHNGRIILQSPTHWMPLPEAPDDQN